MSQDEKRPERPPREPLEAAPSRPAGREAQEVAPPALSGKAEPLRSEQARLREKISQIVRRGEGGRADTVRELAGKAGPQELSHLIEGSGTNPKIAGAALEEMIAQAFETNKQNE